MAKKGSVSLLQEVLTHGSVLTCHGLLQFSSLLKSLPISGRVVQHTWRSPPSLHSAQGLVPKERK